MGAPTDVMITSCRNTHIQNIQCKYSTLGNKLNTSLKYGTKDINCLSEQAKVVCAYLDVLYCYTTFDSAPTFVGKLIFSNPDEDTITVTAAVGAVTIGSYTGAGKGPVIAAEFLSDINDTTTSPNYTALRSGSTIYFYSNDSTLSYATTITISAGSDYVTESVDEDYVAEVLAVWNTITEAELCTIINGAYDIMPVECN